jgi:hypothetical protein
VWFARVPFVATTQLAKRRREREDVLKAEREEERQNLAQLTSTWLLAQLELEGWDG